MCDWLFCFGFVAFLLAKRGFFPQDFMAQVKSKPADAGSLSRAASPGLARERVLQSNRVDSDVRR